MKITLEYLKSIDACNSATKAFAAQPKDESCLIDIVNNGANAGYPGIAYYSDTCALYDQYEDEIWQLLEDNRKGQGMKTCLELVASFGCDAQFKNLLVWFAVEEYARELTNN